MYTFFLKLSRFGTPRLFFISRPSTIYFAIISIVVYAVNSCLFFSKFFNVLKVQFIHIIFEFFKILPKTFNSATAISVIIPSSRFITSIKNMIKNLLKSATIQTVGFINWTHTYSINLTPTSATFRFILQNCILFNDFLFSTITSKKPMDITSSIFRNWFNRGQSKKSLSSSYIHKHKHITGLGNMQHA